MALSSKIEIKDIKNAVVTVGDRNILTVSLKLSEVNQTSLTNKREDWSQVLSQISAIQKIVKDLPDEHEDVRDTKLVPSLAEAKAEVKTLESNPSAPKEAFIDKFKKFCDIAAQVTGVASAVAPMISAVAKIIGIPIP